MPELTADAAERLLRGFGGYEWILDSGQAVWTASDLHRGLEGMGLRVAIDTVARDFDRWAPAVADYGKAGKYTSRDGAMIVLASRIKTQEARDA